jgi:prepilin-type N-terminal cleavage/methylation domain-containing protein
MISSLRRRLASDEKGFTLIELLVVIIILGIRLAAEISARRPPRWMAHGPTVPSRTPGCRAAPASWR